MIDFTLTVYKDLLNNFLNSGYNFITFRQFLKKDFQTKKNVIMRHDVDKLPQNALKMAKLENKLGIKSTYYFREKPCSFNLEIIGTIDRLGHEIGYHYENLDTTKGDFQAAIIDFRCNLDRFRKNVSIDTICMHGSPLSKWNNLDLWKKYSYRDFNILGEPYLDINFKEIQYLTDTGRRWNGDKVAVRDKVNGVKNFNIHKTFGLIKKIKSKQLADVLMINIHPQRWTNNPFLWTKELVTQTIKNQIKYLLIKIRKISNS